ncbi:uncharacterized protein CEXT_233021 [Caerostris extrusa]|uniref:Uncharacterized protein n=1 Tax=Caerostris extrusa TaxID=172846 RepID=A0AAV4VKF4_CAEEX|nr:uncharacterized protein CEXT_233021 [Caerostris extrusa]
MIKKFEVTVESGRGRKPVASTSVEVGATTSREGASSGVQTCSVMGIAQSFDMHVSTVHEMSCNILHCYPYKITHVLELFSADLPVRHTFAQNFCPLGSGQ